MVYYTREAGPDDLSQIKYLLAHNNLLRWPVLPLPDSSWRSRLARDGNGAVIALADEVPVGFTAIEVSGPGAEAGRLAASEPAATEALLGAAEEYAREHGATHLTYRLVGERGPVIDALRRRGYLEEGGWPEYERFHLNEVPDHGAQTRPLSDEDLEAVAEIDRRAFGDVAYPRGFLEAMLAMQEYRLLGVDQDGRLAAFSVQCLLPDSTGYFMKTATLPEERGAGLAGALCAAVIDEFRTAGATRIWAHTWDTNYRGMHLLEKFAFRRTGRSLVMRRTL